VFQIATNAETTVNEIADLLSSVFREFGFDEIKIQYGERRLGDVQRNYSDTSKARERLNWQAEYSLQEGLRLTVDSLHKEMIAS